MDEDALFDAETGEVRSVDECANCARATQERLQAERDLHAAELELRKLRRVNKALTTELQNQQRKQAEYAVAEQLGRYWIIRCGKDPKRTVLGEKRLKKVMARLKDGYSPYYIARAIDGLAEFHYVNENNKMHYNDLELVCRDETMVEKYHDLAEANSTATRIDRQWLKAWGVSDMFADVREQLNDLANLERDGKDNSDMAGQYDDSNRGVLFKNDRKEKDTQPDYRGQINISADALEAAQRGEELELAAWIKKSQAGNPYMSLKVQPKFQPQSGSQAQSQTQAPAAAPEDDDIPF